MTDVILQAETCSSCGQYVTPPADGRWRWARGGKVHESLEAAQRLASQFNAQGKPYEYRAALDDQGRPRIATRRRPA